ncbi:CoA ester lyase [Caenimonas sp. SL110]|uniref:HpcH/HpaI aldolase/citrate lyase family protein n=1 Tax=Caenimonas sp. SL110 TaxID=1450524 RepID=UPI000653A656|nr:CoA ester lyase [Caenimonas sp. SL110]
MLVSRARSFLFLPADRLDRLSKALGSGAHIVIVDLEDGVGANAKTAARTALADAHGALSPADGSRVAVRINGFGTEWHEADIALLRSLARTGLAAAMVPKAESVSQLRELGEALGVPLLPIIESAEGLAALELIARAPGVSRLAFGHLDFQADLAMHCGPDERELDSVRLAFVLASRRAGLAAPIDGVTQALHDDARLVADAERSRRFGFGGKLCIHPRQVVAVNAALGPAASEVEWANRLLAASAAAGPGQGAFAFEGTMADAPVLQRARQILEEITPLPRCAGTASTAA